MTRTPKHAYFFKRTLWACKLFLCCTLFLLLSQTALFAEMVVDNEYGWSLDLPEGFSVSDATEDGMSYLFSHDRFPVFLVMRLYDSGTYESSSDAFDSVLAKLPETTSEKATLVWRSTDCALGTFSMTVNGTQYAGWLTAVALPSSNAHLALLCYADTNAKGRYEAFILSVLNSLAIDRGSYYEPGIIASYAYPATQTKAQTLVINNRTIHTQLGAEAVAASEFVVACEYEVLSLYAGNPKWQAAWGRYYRAIYRDSYGRLKKVAFDIQNALAPDARAENIEYSMAQFLLTWTQNFEYARKKNAADFTSLPAALTGEGCDCDTRSLLICVLLENMGIKTALFVSREYSHAVFGVAIAPLAENENARMKAGGKDFLLGETTAHVNLGLIAKELSDTSKWLPIELP